MKRIDEQAELEALRARVASLEEEKASGSDDKYFREIQALKNAKNKGVGNVEMKIIQDHKRISLWHISGHNIGKRVGPIHPASAEDTFTMFAHVGIKLSLNKPTEEQIEKYKESAEYKKAEAAEIKRRAGKNKSRKESEVERLTQAIAQMNGVRPSEVNRIKDESEVKVGR
jgi:hypothetical protein